MILGGGGVFGTGVMVVTVWWKDTLLGSITADDWHPAMKHMTTMSTPASAIRKYPKWVREIRTVFSWGGNKNPGAPRGAPGGSEK